MYDLTIREEKKRIRVRGERDVARTQFFFQRNVKVSSGREGVYQGVVSD